MEDFFDQDKTRAFVYLLSEGDDKNKVMISDDKLLVNWKNTKKTILVNDITTIKIESKKLLLPLFVGGIFTPIAFLSYFVNLFHPLIHLVSVMVGLLLFYIGWTGKFSFTIIFKSGEEANYLLPSISKNLIAFTEFANAIFKYPRKDALTSYLFFEIERNNLSAIINESNIFPILGYTYDQLKKYKKNNERNEIIAIDPQKTGREVKFIYDLKTNQMRPRLDGPIISDSIIFQKSFNRS